MGNYTSKLNSGKITTMPRANSNSEKIRLAIAVVNELKARGLNQISVADVAKIGMNCGINPGVSRYSDLLKECLSGQLKHHRPSNFYRLEEGITIEDLEQTILIMQRAAGSKRN